MKKYIVRLSEAERKTCQEVIQKLKGSSQKARRARVLLQVDADGPDWCDQQVAEAFDCRERTVANVRKRSVLEGFELALDGRQRDQSTWPPKRLDRAGSRADRTAAGAPADRLGQWSLRLLAREAVEIGGQGLPEPCPALSDTGNSDTAAPPCPASRTGSPPAPAAVSPPPPTACSPAVPTRSPPVPAPRTTPSAAPDRTPRPPARSTAHPASAPGSAPRSAAIPPVSRPPHPGWRPLPPVQHIGPTGYLQRQIAVLAVVAVEAGGEALGEVDIVIGGTEHERDAIGGHASAVEAQGDSAAAMVADEEAGTEYGLGHDASESVQDPDSKYVTMPTCLILTPCGEISGLALCPAAHSQLAPPPTKKSSCPLTIP